MLYKKTNQIKIKTIVLFKIKKKKQKTTRYQRMYYLSFNLSWHVFLPKDTFIIIIIIIIIIYFLLGKEI